MSAKMPTLIMGTAYFGESTSTSMPVFSAWNSSTVPSLATTLKTYQINRFDTAPRYPAYSFGLAETVLGEAGCPKDFLIDSKIMVLPGGSGHMSTQAIEKSLAKSLDSLKTESLNVLYCHAPDKATPIAEQAAAMDAQYRAGKFRYLGVCNFSPEMLEEWIQIATENNYVQPTYYQGLYNLLCRTFEKDMFPLLRKHNIKFVEFCPLMGGFLTGKFTFAKSDEELKGTRFEVNDENYARKALLHFVQKDDSTMHEAVRKLGGMCEKYNLEIMEAAWRWVLFHSGIRDEDAVIIGPRNMQQLEKYIEMAKKGKLPEALVEEMDGLWEVVREAVISIMSY